MVDLIEEWLAENKKLVNKRKNMKKEKREKVKVKSSTEERAQRYKKQNIKKQTKSETRMQLILKKFNLEVETQKIFYYGKENKNFYLADFYLPKLKIVIEVDGGYHKRTEQKVKDCYKNQFYTEKRKLKLIRITNEKLSKIKDEQLKEIIFQLSEKDLGSTIFLK